MTRIRLKTSLLLLTFPLILFSCGHIFGKRVRGNGNVITQNLFSCTSPHAQFGLSTDSTSNNTGVGPNLFSCQTTNPYNVLGTKAWSY